MTSDPKNSGEEITLPTALQKSVQDQHELLGTYRLVSSSRTSVATGEVIDSFGENPLGFIMYGENHRMMVIIVRRGRPRIELTDMSDQQRVELFRSMAAYGGRYTFDGKKITHHIEMSWNEILTGTDV